MRVDYNIDIDSDDNVYRPSDDSYLLIQMIKVDADEDILEIGCGSGIISIHCAKNGANVTAVDINQNALNLTKRNAEKNNISLNIKKSDLFDSIKEDFDVIIFNPPYLPKTDNMEIDDRWDGGKKGDETLVKFLSIAKKYLKEDGRIYICYSDKAPLDRINKIIEKDYRKISEKSKRFRFEKIIGVELQRV